MQIYKNVETKEISCYFYNQKYSKLPNKIDPDLAIRERAK